MKITNERLRELAETLRMEAHWKAVKAADHIRDFGGDRAPFYMGTLQGAETAYRHAAEIIDRLLADEDRAIVGAAEGDR